MFLWNFNYRKKEIPPNCSLSPNNTNKYTTNVKQKLLQAF